MYYPINEELARRAKESYSHFDYDEGSATYYYRVRVDEAYAIAEEAKKTVDAEYHAKIETAKKFLTMGLSLEQISQGTGLSIDEIKTLQ